MKITKNTQIRIKQYNSTYKKVLADYKIPVVCIIKKQLDKIKDKKKIAISNGKDG